MIRIYREGDDVQELVDDIVLHRERDHNHSLKKREAPKTLLPVWDEFEQLFVPQKTTLASRIKEKLRRALGHKGRPATARVESPTLTNQRLPVVRGDTILPQTTKPGKPTMQIFPIDRMFIERYISRAYCALVSAGYPKDAAIAKTWEWKGMADPCATLKDILRTVDIAMVDTVPFRYFEC